MSNADWTIMLVGIIAFIGGMSIERLITRLTSIARKEGEMTYYACPEHGADSTDIDLETGEIICWKCDRPEDQMGRGDTPEEAEEDASGR